MTVYSLARHRPLKVAVGVADGLRRATRSQRDLVARDWREVLTQAEPSRWRSADDASPSAARSVTGPAAHGPPISSVTLSYEVAKPCTVLPVAETFAIESGISRHAGVPRSRALGVLSGAASRSMRLQVSVVSPAW